MLDIDFYMKFDAVYEQLQRGRFTDRQQLFDALEEIRSKDPIVYNIETTNRCNMRCEMCPRTTMMTRRIEDIDHDTFIAAVKQLRPHAPELWTKWKRFCEEKYHIAEDDPTSSQRSFSCMAMAIPCWTSTWRSMFRSLRITDSQPISVVIPRILTWRPPIE